MFTSFPGRVSPQPMPGSASQGVEASAADISKVASPAALVRPAQQKPARQVKEADFVSASPKFPRQAISMNPKFLRKQGQAQTQAERGSWIASLSASAKCQPEVAQPDIGDVKAHTGASAPAEEPSTKRSRSVFVCCQGTSSERLSATSSCI